MLDGHRPESLDTNRTEVDMTEREWPDLIAGLEAMRAEMEAEVRRLEQQLADISNDALFNDRPTQEKP